jgi:hypothetical protein
MQANGNETVSVPRPQRAQGHLRLARVEANSHEGLVEARAWTYVLQTLKSSPPTRRPRDRGLPRMITGRAFFT